MKKKYRVVNNKGEALAANGQLSNFKCREKIYSTRAGAEKLAAKAGEWRDDSPKVEETTKKYWGGYDLPEFPVEAFAPIEPVQVFSNEESRGGEKLCDSEDEARAAQRKAIAREIQLLKDRLEKLESRLKTI